MSGTFWKVCEGTKFEVGWGFDNWILNTGQEKSSVFADEPGLESLSIKHCFKS